MAQQLRPVISLPHRSGSRFLKLQLASLIQERSFTTKSDLTPNEKALQPEVAPDQDNERGPNVFFAGDGLFDVLPVRPLVFTEFAGKDLVVSMSGRPAF